jgi:chaperonin GroEL
MEDKTKIKDITFNAEAHKHIHDGVAIMAQAVGSTYGPGGRNVLVQKPYVQPILTRDGVAVAREIAGHGKKLRHPIASQAAQLVYQASEKTNKSAGDGTSATVLLLAESYKSGWQRIVAGEDPMVIRKKLYEARDTVSEYIRSKSQKCDEKMLRQVATISCGDPALGAMIADLVWDVGADGAISLTYQNTPTIEVDKVTGYLLNQGFRFLPSEAELEAPLIFVSQKRLDSRMDIIPILEIVASQKKHFIIVADISGAAQETFMAALAQQKIDGVFVPPPAFGPDGHDYFVDIATYTGARVWLEADAFKDVKLEDFGVAKSARVSREQAILFGTGETGDAIAERIAKIDKQMDRSDITPSLKETLDNRKAKLAGKVSIIRIGAATENEREELYYRVEDAVEACKSALETGVVAGGATTLLFASSYHLQADVPYIDKFIVEALRMPFRLLMANAGEDGGYRLQQVFDAGYGKGFNLRDMTEQPIDLYKAGVVDATKVILQVVANAFSIAGSLLTTGTVITDGEAKDETV